MEIQNQSLAEARLAQGLATEPHFHLRTEEIYSILEGEAEMKSDDEQQAVSGGDAIAISPGQVHRVRNIGKKTLVFLCCYAPGYEHNDTVLIGDTS